MLVDPIHLHKLDWSRKRSQACSEEGNKDYVTRLHHHVTKEKGWNSSEAFQAAKKSGFCGRELLPLACTLSFVTLQTVYMHKKLHNTLKDREKTGKHNRSPLTC